MRSVGARAQAAPRVVRDGTRGKAKSRTPSARGRRRASSEWRFAYGEELRARFGWLGGTFLFRHPMLALTLLLICGGGIMGLLTMVIARRRGARRLWLSDPIEERRAMAVALEQEMRARVVEAEAEVPRAMAEAFRQGNLGIMDYYKMKNVQADTAMRDAIADGDHPAATPRN